jgi:formamidopyrimidine-DNA glycosylase
VPELPEMEILARRLDGVVPGREVAAVSAVGVNVLRSFDPALETLVGGRVLGVGRRGKLLFIEVETRDEGVLVLLMHLMSAGRLQVVEKETSLRDRALRFQMRFDSGDFLRLREFGSRQSAWIKLLRKDALFVDEYLVDLGPEAWPDPPPLKPLLSVARPLHSLLRDQKVIAGIGRTWVDEILHHAKFSPFRRGDDLSEEDAEILRSAIKAELGRALAEYETTITGLLPEKYPKPVRVHGLQGQPCYRCETKLEAVFFESYVMTYCPHCQTGGKLLKDRRLSRLLK